jgi:hypothetical protein
VVHAKKARRCRSSLYNDDVNKLKVKKPRAKTTRQQTLENSSFAKLAKTKETKQLDKEDGGQDDENAGTDGDSPSRSRARRLNVKLRNESAC